MMSPSELRDKLLAERTRRAVSQNVAASEIGINISTLRRIEQKGAIGELTEIKILRWIEGGKP